MNNEARINGENYTGSSGPFPCHSSLWMSKKFEVESVAIRRIYGRSNIESTTYKLYLILAIAMQLLHMNVTSVCKEVNSMEAALKHVAP